MPGRAREAAPVPGDAAATASSIDTDGDGIADTLAVRVDAHQTPRPGLFSRLGAFLGRSIVLIVFVAALVVAGAAATSLYHTRNDLQAASGRLETQQALLVAAQSDLKDADARITDLERSASDAGAAEAAAEAERDELALEARVLRNLLFDSERSSAAR